MTTPSEPAPDSTVSKTPLDDDAHSPDERSLEESSDELKADTESPAAETIPAESFVAEAADGGEEATSDSAVRDVSITDASVLEEDGAAQQPIAESDVILREGPVEGGLEDFAPQEDDEDETADDGVPWQVDLHTPQSDAADSGNEQRAGAVEAFDLETPTPDAQFPLLTGGGDAKPAGDARAFPRTSAQGESASAQEQSGGKGWLKLYASVITIVCIYLLLQLLREFRPHQLENLPDVPALREGESQFYPVDAVLPGGHVLQLGEARRFGNILVEPLRVTYGPVEFEHWRFASRTRPPSEESVVKLWLRFTNVSDDQEIAPFTARLVMHARVDNENNLRSNSFLRRKNGDDVEFMFQLPQSSEWELADQEMGVLKPRESFVTYAATGFEHLPQIVGEVGSEQHDLVWRLHIRKGFGPAGNGVTTLIDVAFNSSVIEPEES